MARADGGGGGGGRGLLVVIAIIGAWWYFSHQQQPKVVIKSDDTSPSTSSAGTHNSYALQAGLDNWPTLGDTARTQVNMADAGVANYYVVLDGSGSMREHECAGGGAKIDAAVVALRQFIAKVPADANLGLAVFDRDGVSERVPLGRGNREAFAAALARVRADGSTPLRSAMGLGYDKLLGQGMQQLGYGEYHLVVVTDGKPEPADEDPTSEVQTMLAQTPVVLHTIGFCIGEDHVLNQRGRSYYVAADSPEQLQQGLGAVLAEAPKFDSSTFKN